MKRSEMTIAGAEQLFVTEAALEQALAEAAQLASTLTRMRGSSKLSLSVGQGAMNEITATITHLTAARGALVRAHTELDEVRTRIGCATVSVGFWDKGRVEHGEPA